MVAVLAKPEPLPGAEVEGAVGDGDGEGDADEGGLDVARHVVRSLAGVLVGQALGCDLVEEHFGVGEDVLVPALVEADAGGGVEEGEVRDADADLRQLRERPRHVLRDVVAAPPHRRQRHRPLQPHAARSPRRHLSLCPLSLAILSPLLQVLSLRSLS